MKLDKQQAAVVALKESFALLADDQDLLIDTIEGETEFFEAIDRLLLQIADDKARAVGLASVINDFKTRMERFEARAATCKAMIEQALSIAEITEKVQRPAATLSMAKRAPSVVVVEESEIPSAYWKLPPPVLDKAKLAADLKDRAAALDARFKATIDNPNLESEELDAIAPVPPSIPGAELSNAAPSLTVRFK